MDEILYHLVLQYLFFLFLTKLVQNCYEIIIFLDQSLENWKK